jgi:hypothetical protein
VQFAPSLLPSLHLIWGKYLLASAYQYPPLRQALIVTRETPHQSQFHYRRHRHHSSINITANQAATCCRPPLTTLKQDQAATTTPLFCAPSLLLLCRPPRLALRICLAFTPPPSNRAPSTETLPSKGKLISRAACLILDPKNKYLGTHAHGSIKKGSPRLPKQGMWMRITIHKQFL